MNPYKLKHFYINKYIVSPFARHKYFISYNYKYKTIWFHNYKVASRTIRNHFEENTPANQDIYSSQVGYLPSMLDSFYKFAFVREPADRFFSSWKNKVLEQNYFNFNTTDHTRHKNFSEYISWVEGQDIDTCDIHIRSQNSLIDLNEINFLGRFESFNDDFKFLCQKVGLPNQEIKTKNKSKDINFEINQEDYSRIKKIYFKDYKMFYPHLI